MACSFFLSEIWRAIGGDRAALARVSFSNAEFAVPSAFPVSDLAAASIAAAGLALSEFVAAVRDSQGTDAAAAAEPGPAVEVDMRLASLWFSTSFRPTGWAPPPPWDALAGDYLATHDAWIRLHTNAPHHRAAALEALGLPATATRAEVAAAVSAWDADALEAAVVAAGGCAATMRSVSAWAAHPQGTAVATEPLVRVTSSMLFMPSNAMDLAAGTGGGTGGLAAGSPGGAHVEGSRQVERSSAPLRGVRVLDLTRIIAGPVATRTLAGWGAEVLRVDPEGWEESGTLHDTTLGKRCARLNLKSPGAVGSAAAERVSIVFGSAPPPSFPPIVEGLSSLRSLLASADVLVHGYRPGALDALPGFGPAERAALHPGLVEVSLSAYGGTSPVGDLRGPWSARRGFDSLVQMSCGIADAGRAWAAATGVSGGDPAPAAASAPPVPLPVQALDHATGYILAAAALRGLALRTTAGQRANWRGGGGGSGVATFSASTSLARVAALLVEGAAVRPAAAPVMGAARGVASLATDADFDADPAAAELTAWGPGLRMRPPVRVHGHPLVWTLPACPLGSAAASWVGDR